MLPKAYNTHQALSMYFSIPPHPYDCFVRHCRCCCCDPDADICRGAAVLWEGGSKYFKSLQAILHSCRYLSQNAMTCQFWSHMRLSCLSVCQSVCKVLQFPAGACCQVDIACKMEAANRPSAMEIKVWWLWKSSCMMFSRKMFSSTRDREQPWCERKLPFGYSAVLRLLSGYTVPRWTRPSSTLNFFRITCHSPSCKTHSEGFLKSMKLWSKYHVWPKMFVYSDCWSKVRAFHLPMTVPSLNMFV